METDKTINGFYNQRSFPVFNVTSHPLDCVLDSGHRQVWQRTLVAVESRLPARKNTHQSLAKKNSRNRHESFQHSCIRLCKNVKNSDNKISRKHIRCIIFFSINVSLFSYTLNYILRDTVWCYGGEKVQNTTDHPDFCGCGHFPMRLKHPAVVWEELLEAQTHGEDEQQPQHGAEDHCWQQHLALGTHRLAGIDGWRQWNGLRVRIETLKKKHLKSNRKRKKTCL